MGLLEVFMVQCIVTVAMADPLYKGIITYDRSDTDFQKLILDNATGRLFVGAKNHLFKLTSSLALEEEVSTGPVMDNGECHPFDKGCSDLTLVDNDAKILLLDPSFHNILFCGSVQQGMCFFYDGNDFQSKHAIYEKTNGSNENLVGGNASVVAFYSVLELSNRNVNVLHVGQEYDRRPLSLSPLSMSSQHISENSDSYQMGYLRHDTVQNIYSGKDIHHNVKESYRVKYIHGFEYKGFLFYLTVQRQYISNGNFTTKLVRVCQKSLGESDTGYYSYTEIELACRKKNGITTFFNIAEAAFLGPIGAEFANNFGIKSDEQVLYVTFGQSKGSNTLTIDETKGSGVCIFLMTNIMREFQVAQEDCYSGKGNLLPWIHPGDIGCETKYQVVALITENLYYCGQDMANDAIGHRGYNLLTDTNVTLAGHYATSILVQVQKGDDDKEKTVAILGTAQGTILKVLIDGTNAPPYVNISIAPGDVEDPRVAKEMTFDPTGEYVYAMTKNRIAKVPIQTCGVYKDCASCVSSRDALDCGWCGDVSGHCSVKNECSSASWKNDACPPVVLDFKPRSGPVQGGTRVTLTGEYFGNFTAATTKIVLVAFENCEINSYSATMIICTTTASENLQEKTNSVSLEVVDASKTTASFEIRGKANLGQTSFAYKKAELEEVTPLLGPKSGGSRLTVVGRNLDIGANLEVSVATLPCKPISTESTQILCNTSAVPTRRRKRSVRTGPIRVSIDGVELTKDGLMFSYEEDPFVTDVQPRKSIAKGGIEITISGGNLHVVHMPQIVIQDLASGVNYSDDCEATPKQMICITPEITQDRNGKKPTATEPLDFTLNFAMDGVSDLIDFPSQHPELSDFKYYIDPAIHDFEKTVLKFYIDEDFLELKGSYLDFGVSKENYRVKVDTESCEVTFLKSGSLHCKMVTPDVVSENEITKDVVVTVGNLVFRPGYLVFAERNMNIVIAAIVGPVLLLLLLLIIILVVWMKKSHRGPFRKPREELSVRYNNRDADAADGRDRSLHSNPYTSGTNMLRHRHVGEREHEPLIDSDCRNFLIESHLLIDRDDVLLLDIIGQGNFGCVYKGLLKVPDEKQEEEVAVKTLKTLTETFLFLNVPFCKKAAYTSAADARSFLEEALRMREFDHPNILRLIGIALDKEEQPLVILPFMKHGDLLTYIRDETNSPTIKDLMDFAIQIAEGMAYLSKLKFVHRDLAARNCMLNDGMEVQVADFGLSRDIYERDYYSSDGRKAKLPVKWMALESLEKGIYNIKTDVWSYGVVIWELMTRGVTPYPEVDNWEIIKFLKPGRRMPQPAYCPDSLYNIMLKCWEPEAGSRPTFPELVTSIQQIMYEMENRQEQQQFTRSQHQVYANVPTSQTYLYPSTLPHYGGVGGGGDGDLRGAMGGCEVGDPLVASGAGGTVQLLGLRDHNENEQFSSMLV